MYRLIIADDERIIRDGLKNLIKWNELGFEVVQVLKDGIEILKYIKNNPVDVILTDIKMTTSSGIDVAEFVHSNRLNIKVVFNSGYKEFEYAQKGIQYGVEYYLLKPTDIEKTSLVFEELYEKLEEERNTQKAIELMKDINEIAPNMKEQFFFNIIFKNATVDDNYINKMLNILFSENQLKGMETFLFEIKLIDYQNYISSFWQLGVEQFSFIVKNYIQMYKSNNIEFLPIYMGKDIILVLGFKKNEKKFADDYQSSKYVDTFCTDLCVFFTCEAKAKLIAEFNSFQELMSLDLLFSEDLEDLYARERHKLQTALKIEKNESEINALVQKAKELISENLMTGVTLEDIADKLYISSPHLSRLFKKETNENFINYVVRLKMEKAANLLMNEKYKVYEICDMLGYKNVKYFTQLFKAQYNLTPTAYKERDLK